MVIKLIITPVLNFDVRNVGHKLKEDEFSLETATTLYPTPPPFSKCLNLLNGFGPIKEVVVEKNRCNNRFERLQHLVESVRYVANTCTNLDVFRGEPARKFNKTVTVILFSFFR